MALHPDVSELTSDTALGAVGFDIERFKRDWENGEFVEVGKEEIPATGVIVPESSMQSDEYSAEGTVQRYAIRVYTQTALCLRDEILFQGWRFLVTAVKRWDAYGWCYAEAALVQQRKGGLQCQEWD